MRFIKADTEQGPRLGVVRPDGVAELARTESRLESHFGDDGSALRALAAAIHADPAGEYGLESLTLLKPVDPVSMRDFMVFEEHILPSWRRSGLSRGPDVWYEQPIGYFSNAATIRGPRDPIEIPGGSERLDFELEVGAVIGRETVSVTPAEAADRIAGFCILCDWSARDLQFREMDGRLGPFKGKDFGSSLGPIFVTPDELAARRSGNGYDLLMTSGVNGRRYGSDHWSSAYWSFEELISYSSWNSRVEAGAIIGSGTCQGGCILELSARHSTAEYPWLAPGDEVTLSIELMGEIRAQGPARRPRPLARPQDHHPGRRPEDPRIRRVSEVGRVSEAGKWGVFQRWMSCGLCPRRCEGGRWPRPVPCCLRGPPYRGRAARPHPHAGVVAELAAASRSTVQGRQSRCALGSVGAADHGVSALTHRWRCQLPAVCQVPGLISWPTTYSHRRGWYWLAPHRSRPRWPGSAASVAASRIQRGDRRIIRLRRCLRGSHGVRSPGVRRGYRDSRWHCAAS